MNSSLLPFFLSLATVLSIASPTLAQSSGDLQFFTQQFSPQPFSQWCQILQQLPEPQQRTVEALLAFAQTTDCVAAEQKLLGAGFINLIDRQLTDLTPLASLTTVSGLDLSFNQIEDLHPLQNLPNLSFLLLAGNQIEDVTPLANLPNLTYLVLEQNQIRDVNALAPLTNLTALNLLNNPLQQKACPVNPTTICLFSDDALAQRTEAEELLQQGRFREALVSFQATLAINEANGDRQKQGDTLDRLGNIYLRLGQYATALAATHEQALALRQTLEDLPGIGVSLASIAQAYDFLGQYPQAEDYFNLALENMEQQEQSGIPLEGGLYDLPRDQALTYTRLAQVQNKQGKYIEARRSLQQALGSYQVIPPTYYDYDAVQVERHTALETLEHRYSSHLP